MIAYGAALAPDLSLPYPHARIPEFNQTPADNETIKKWERGFGEIDAKVAVFLAKKIPLKAVRIAYGEYDEYSWIPKGCKRLAVILADKGIPSKLISYKRGHEITDDLVKRYMLVFFNEQF